MSKVNTKRRSNLIRKRQQRRKSIRKLRELYLAARLTKDQDAILEKIRRRAPYLIPEEYVKSGTEKK